jgi:hypothetical protein
VTRRPGAYVVPDGGPVVLDRPDTVERVDDGSGGDSGLEGWFCISTAPWVCADCKQRFEHVVAEGSHLIVVWPEKDDPNLLKWAQKAVDNRMSPRVKEYEESMGGCTSYYALRL